MSDEVYDAIRELHETASVEAGMLMETSNSVAYLIAALFEKMDESDREYVLEMLWERNLLPEAINRRPKYGEVGQ